MKTIWRLLRTIHTKEKGIRRKVKDLRAEAHELELTSVVYRTFSNIRAVVALFAVLLLGLGLFAGRAASQSADGRAVDEFFAILSSGVISSVATLAITLTVFAVSAWVSLWMLRQAFLAVRWGVRRYAR